MDLNRAHTNSSSLFSDYFLLSFREIETQFLLLPTVADKSREGAEIWY